MQFINESMYCHGTGGICNCLSRLLHEVLGCAPGHSSADFLLYSKNLTNVGRITPKNYSMFYNRMKVCIVN